VYFADIVDVVNRVTLSLNKKQTLQTVSEFLRSVVPSGEAARPLAYGFWSFKKTSIYNNYVDTGTSGHFEYPECHVTCREIGSRQYRRFRYSVQ
jgi:hypothetical protein